MRIHAIVVALISGPLLSGSAQVFDFSQSGSVYFAIAGHPATLSGTATVDPDANTLAINGQVLAAPGFYNSTQARTIIVPGAFPHVEIYNESLTVTYHLPAVNLPLLLDPVEPLSVGGSIYRTAFTDSVSTLDIAFDYVLTENGSPVTTGSGGYQVRGGPGGITLDVIGYPSDLKMTIASFRLDPTSSAPIVNFVSGRGQLYQVGPLSVNVTTPHVPVPEPYGWTAACGIGLLLFGVARRRRC